MKEFTTYLFISFITAFILIVLSKIIMTGLMRKDRSYYEKRESAEEEDMLSKVKIKERTVLNTKAEHDLAVKEEEADKKAAATVKTAQGKEKGGEDDHIDP